MPVIQGRLALALGFSSAAHVGLVWMAIDEHRAAAAPAQRALTVAMTPAAPRAVLNSIAPSAAEALSPAVVRPLEPSTVSTVDDADTVVAARVIDNVELLDAALVEIRGPRRRLRARDAPPTPVAMALAKQAEMNATRLRRRDRAEQPVPANSTARPATSPRAQPDAASRAAAAPARTATRATPGSDREAHPPTAVAGQPGADRSALPAAGNAPPEYPWVARAQGHQGRVVLSVWVSADGQADRLAVLKSSGHASLDRAAVRAVEGWRFRPARRGGHDAASMLYVPVVFRLDD